MPKEDSIMYVNGNLFLSRIVDYVNEQMVDGSEDAEELESMRVNGQLLFDVDQLLQELEHIEKKLSGEFATGLAAAKVAVVLTSLIKNGAIKVFKVDPKVVKEYHLEKLLEVK